jgi:small multidrug resistance family-3 protein
LSFEELERGGCDVPDVVSLLPHGTARSPPGHFIRTLGLFVITAVAEIVGCYLPYLWLKRNGSAWLLVPAFASLALFAWLLTLHPTAVGRVYAAYGGVYVGVAILWRWLVDGNRPTSWDLLGAAVALTGMAIIMLGPRHTSGVGSYSAAEADPAIERPKTP